MALERFEIFERLAIGGMAELFLARDEETDQHVVIKRARTDVDRRFDALLRTEAALTLPLSHPNLVRTLALVEIAERPCLVLELVEGESLAKLQRERGNRALSPGMAAHLAREVAAGLAHVHAAEPTAIVHGDVNLSNVLVSRNGDVKLGDFGIAELLGTVRGSAELRGQPGHVAPEILRGGPADPRSDLFLLGLMLAEMLRGDPVFDAKNPEAALDALQSFHPRELEKPPVVPEELWRLAVALLQPEPKRRPGEAHEVFEALSEFAAPVRKENVAALFRRVFPEWRSPANPRLPPPVAEEPETVDAPTRASPVYVPEPRLDSPTPFGIPAFTEAPEALPTPREPMAAVRLDAPTPARPFERFDAPTPARPFDARVESPTPAMPLARFDSPTPATPLPALQVELPPVEPHAGSVPERLARVIDSGHAQERLTDAELLALEVPREVLLRVPRAWAERLNVMPVAASSGVMVVACAEPDPGRALANLRSVTGFANVRRVRASADAIRAAIERSYDAAGLKREPLLRR